MTPAKHSFNFCPPPPPPRIFVLVTTTLLLLTLSAIPVFAATITVSGNCSLAEAIQNAKDNEQTNSDCAAGDGNDLIRLTSDITLTGNVTLAAGDRLEVRTTLTINGNDHTLSGPGSLLDARGATSTDRLTLTINRLTLTNNNSASSDGRALRIWNGASLVVNNSTFKNISANDNEGAAIQVRSEGRNVTINNSTFSGNFAKRSGGVISSIQTGTTITISNSRFSDNESDGNGGVISISSGVTVNISGSSFSSNEAASSGGAISVNDGNSNLSITNSIFSSNSAANHGGAIYQNAPASIYRSTFYSNSAGDHGGAISNQWNLRLENSTFYNNTAVNEGGALGSDDFFTQTVDIRHVTFVNNESTASGKNGNSVFIGPNITGNMYNSIIKEKSKAATDTTTDCVGLDTNTNNIIEDGSCSTSSTYSVDPLLGGRAGNPAYYTLRANSPAIDAANATQCTNLRDENGIDVDQRGRARPYNLICDIGAYEWYPPPPPDDDDNGGPAFRPTDIPLSAPINRSLCAHCDELLAQGYRLSATHGLASGVQFRRLDSSGVGIQWVLDEGFRDAVDVWGFAEQGGEVCFPDSGRLLLLDAAHSPRRAMSVDAYSESGLTCANFDRAGTLVLLDGPPPAPVAAPVQAPPGHLLLQGCMVTTDHIVNFRESPGGALFHFVDPWGAPIAGWLPFNVTLTALERAGNWIKVDYHGTQGWIHADYVTLHGTCG